MTARTRTRRRKQLVTVRCTEGCERRFPAGEYPARCMTHERPLFPVDPAAPKGMVCLSCTVGDHQKCTGVGCYGCPERDNREVHRKHGCVVPAAGPAHDHKGNE